jgi:hypothetical protein
MRLPQNYNVVLNTFAARDVVMAYEREGQFVNGRWEYTQSEPRKIKAIVLQADAEKLELLIQGAVAQGGISLITKEVLYYNRTTANQTQGKQSFVQTKGFTFRLIEDGWLNPNTNMYSYTLIKHEDNT